MRFLCAVKVACMWIVLGVYSLLMIMTLLSWLRLRTPNSSFKSSRPVSVSIIIPARNESQHILNLLEDLSRQSATDVSTEVVVVDDHSTDDTAEIAMGFSCDKMNLKVHQLLTGEGKKAALREGIAHTSGELIITLDADVRVGKDWLASIVTFYQSNRSAMIILPVMFSGRKDLFNLLQLPEMLSLQVITAASAQVGTPVMCNGANLAFRRSAWNRAGVLHGSGASGGDDVFLLQTLKSKGVGPVHWLHDLRAAAITESPSSLIALFSQRIRWASKSRLYRDGLLLFLTGVVALTNISAVLMMAFGLAGVFSWDEVLMWYGIKTIIDLLLILPASFWYRRMQALWTVPVVALFYPWYALTVALASLFIRPKWKGRKVSLSSPST